MAGDGEARVLGANEAFYAAFNAKDEHAMERLWATSPAVACVHPGWNMLVGRKQVLASWGAIFANPDQPAIVSAGAVALVDGRLAVVTCRELVAGEPLTATNLFSLEGEEWRLLHHHSSPVAFTADFDAPDREGAR